MTGFGIWIEIYLDLCDVVRLQIDMQSWKMDGLVIFNKTTQSPSIKQLSVFSFINDQKTSRIQIRVARCFIRHKRTTEVRGSNPTKTVFQFFSGMYFSEVHIHTTARLYAKPIKEQVGILVMVCFKIARTCFALDIYPLKNQSTSQLHYVKIITVRAPARGRSHAQCGGSNLT